MTKYDNLPFEYGSVEIQNERKISNRKYWQNQNAKRMNVGLSRKLMTKFRTIRKSRGFKNDDQMLEFLLDIAEDAQKANLVQGTLVCSDCGTKITVDLADYIGINHHKLDKNSNCFGNIITKYGLKDIKDSTSEQDEQEDDATGTKGSSKGATKTNQGTFVLDDHMRVDKDGNLEFF